MNVKRFVGCLTMLVLGAANLPSQATEVWHASYLRMIYPQSDGSVVLVFTSDSTSCTSANDPDYYRIVVGQNGVTADGLRAMHATALTAFAMGRQLVIAFDSSNSGCYINRLLITEQ